MGESSKIDFMLECRFFHAHDDICLMNFHNRIYRGKNKGRENPIDVKVSFFP